MAGDVQFITLGGTLLMKPTGDEHALAPFYSVQDVVVHKALELIGKRERLPYRKQQCLQAQKILLEKGEAGYPEIGRLMVDTANLTDRAALDVVRTNALVGTEAALGYTAKTIDLPYGPIDSINFDVDMHYPALREAVLATIRKGDVPVIGGGTDTLRYYGALLQEDLTQLQASGAIPHLPPVILASSMRAFGSEGKVSQNHVYRVLKAARMAADEAVDNGLSGVFALLPADAEVSSATLIDMSKPVDKISATLDKAFVGEEVLRVHPNSSLKGSVYPNHDPRRHAEGMAQHIPPYRHGLVAPPLEAANPGFTIAQTLHAIHKYKTSFPFDAVIIKGDLSRVDSGSISAIQQLAAALTLEGRNVFCVNDPVVDAKSRALTFDPDFHQSRGLGKRQEQLEHSGIIFVDGMSSTQLHIRAGQQDAEGAPVHFVQEREEARAHALKMLGGKAPDMHGLERRLLGTGKDGQHFGRHRAQALAIEYMPDANAYATMLKLARSQKIPRVISVNCTDGSMAAHHNVALGNAKHGGTRVVGSFKYAGVAFDDVPETASMSRYAPALYLSEEQLAIPGHDIPPAELLAQAQGKTVSARGR